MLAKNLKENMLIRFSVEEQLVTIQLSEVTILDDFVDVEGYYTDEMGGLAFTSFNPDDEVEVVEPRKMTGTFHDFLPEGNFTEEDLWEAIAESRGVDVSEIADGDLTEYL